jgi:hypothetical protein
VVRLLPAQAMGGRGFAFNAGALPWGAGRVAARSSLRRLHSQPSSLLADPADGLTGGLVVKATPGRADELSRLSGKPVTFWTQTAVAAR